MATHRRATHAGSWYSDDPKYLAAELQGWIQSAGGALRPEEKKAVRALIGPHAGFSYSGETAAYAYRHMDPAKIKRVFIIGPSHHFHTRKCLLTQANTYGTPFGDVVVDRATVDALHATGAFDTMSMDVDEEEHSIELHLPYVVMAMQGRPFSIVPIMVGSIGGATEAQYGKILAQYLPDESNFFVISSDFCHWGSRFRFQWQDPELGPIYKSIEWLDKTGMDLISSGDPDAFKSYLHKYENTICGRHPISLMMVAFNEAAASKACAPFDIGFVRYAQSSQCCSKQDSSVSYASAVVSCQAGTFSCGPPTGGGGGGARAGFVGVGK